MSKNYPFLHFLCTRVRSQSCEEWPPGVLYLHIQTAVNAGDMHTWRITVILISGKNTNTPNWSPMSGGKWHQFLNLRSKSVRETHVVFQTQFSTSENQAHFLSTSWVIISTHVHIPVICSLFIKSKRKLKSKSNFLVQDCLQTIRNTSCDIVWCEWWVGKSAGEGG